MKSRRKPSSCILGLCLVIVLVALFISDANGEQKQQQQQQYGISHKNLRQQEQRRNTAAAAANAEADYVVHRVQINNNKKQSNNANHKKKDNEKFSPVLLDDSTSNTKTTDTSSTIKVEVPSSSSMTDRSQKKITTTDNDETLSAEQSSSTKRSNWVTVLSYSFLLLTIVGFVGSFVLCCIHIRRDFYLIDRDALKERIRRERIFDFATKRRADILESVFAQQCFQACSQNKSDVTPLHPQNQNENNNDIGDDEECGNCHQQQQRSNNKRMNGHYSALASSSSMEDDLDLSEFVKHNQSFESNTSTSTPLSSTTPPPPSVSSSSSSPRRPMNPKKSQQQEELYHSSPLSVYDSSAYYNSNNSIQHHDEVDECDGLRSSSRSILLRMNSQGELDSHLMQQCQYHCSLPDGNSSERKFPTLSPSFSNDEDHYASTLQPLPKDSNQQDSSSSSNEDLADECAICLCEHEVGEVLTRSKHCTHVFHKECIFEWLKSHDVCPCCRTPLITEDEVLNAASTLLQQQQQQTTKTTTRQ